MGCLGWRGGECILVSYSQSYSYFYSHFEQSVFLFFVVWTSIGSMFLFAPRFNQLVIWKGAVVVVYLSSFQKVLRWQMLTSIQQSLPQTREPSTLRLIQVSVNHISLDIMLLSPLTIPQRRRQLHPPQSRKTTSWLTTAPHLLLIRRKCWPRSGPCLANPGSGVYCHCSHVHEASHDRTAQDRWSS